MLEWLKYKYHTLSDGTHGEMRVYHGLVHTYLGIIFDFSVKWKVKIRIHYYMKETVNTFPDKRKSISENNMYYKSGCWPVYQVSVNVGRMICDPKELYLC